MTTQLYRIFPTAYEKAVEEYYTRIAPVQGKGMGVFARRDIPRGIRVAVFPGWVTKGDTSSYAWNTFRIMPNKTVQEVSIDVANPRDVHPTVDPIFAHYVGPRVNEPDQGKTYNLDVVYNFTKNPPTVEYWSAKKIAKDEELTVCYGDTYDDFRKEKNNYVGCQQRAKHLYPNKPTTLTIYTPPEKVNAEWLSAMTPTPSVPPSAVEVANWVHTLEKENNRPRASNQLPEKRSAKPRVNDDYVYTAKRTKKVKKTANQTTAKAPSSSNLLAAESLMKLVQSPTNHTIFAKKNEKTDENENNGLRGPHHMHQDDAFVNAAGRVRSRRKKRDDELFEYDSNSSAAPNNENDYNDATDQRHESKVMKARRAVAKAQKRSTDGKFIKKSQKSLSNNESNIPSTPIHVDSVFPVVTRQVNMSGYNNTSTFNHPDFTRQVRQFLRTTAAKKAWYTMIAVGQKIDQGKIPMYEARQAGAGRKTYTITTLIMGFMIQARQYILAQGSKFEIKDALQMARALAELAKHKSPALAEALDKMNDSTFRKQTIRYFEFPWSSITKNTSIRPFDFNSTFIR